MDRRTRSSRAVEGPDATLVVSKQRPQFKCDALKLSEDALKRCIASKLCPEGQLKLGDRCEDPVFKVYVQRRENLVDVAVLPSRKNSDEQRTGRAQLGTSQVSIDAIPPAWTGTLKFKEPRLTNEKRTQSTNGPCPADLENHKLGDLLNSFMQDLPDDKNLTAGDPRRLIQVVTKAGFIAKSKEQCSYTLTQIDTGKVRQVPLTAEQRERMLRDQELKLTDGQERNASNIQDISNETGDRVMDEEHQESKTRLDTLIESDDAGTKGKSGD